MLRPVMGVNRPERAKSESKTKKIYKEKGWGGKGRERSRKVKKRIWRQTGHRVTHVGRERVEKLGKRGACVAPNDRQ